MKRVVFDTNLYIDWINRGVGETWMIGRGLVRYLSAVVVMELRAGAHTRGGRHAVDHIVRGYLAGDRVLVPTTAVFDRAGSVLRKLKLAGREVRSASLVNDVLVALSARAVGATVVTANTADFEAIRAIEPFELESA